MPLSQVRYTAFHTAEQITYQVDQTAVRFGVHSTKELLQG
jgi:hypothetical protein